MTAEEAAKILKETLYDEKTSNEYLEAVRMAREALEQEPCEDCISRQAVLDLAKKGVLISNDNYKCVCRAINDLPSVNSVKTGHWIDHRYYMECSICEFPWKYSENMAEQFKYCPNCGAKMESEVSDAVSD